jgi:hypothetical protein
MTSTDTIGSRPARTKTAPKPNFRDTSRTIEARMAGKADTNHVGGRPFMRLSGMRYGAQSAM